MNESLEELKQKLHQELKEKIENKALEEIHKYESCSIL